MNITTSKTSNNQHPFIPQRCIAFILKYRVFVVAEGLLGILSSWMGAAEYQWEKQKVFFCEYGILSVVVPLVLASILQAVHCYLGQQQQSAIDKLKKDADAFYSIKRQIPTIIKIYVSGIYQNLNLTNDDRITLYLSCDGGFLPCSRYSLNPSILSIKRPIYRNKQGVIQQVWMNAWWFDNKFPNPANEREYRNYHKENYGLTAAEVKSLSMKAELYCGIRILDTSNREAIAVLIIESMNKNSLDELVIKEKLEKEIAKLAPLLENTAIRSCIPNQSIIEAEEGF